MNIKKISRALCIVVMTAMLIGVFAPQQAFAKTYYYYVKVKVKSKKKKLTFGYKSDWVYTNQGYTAVLKHVKKGKVKWSVSNKKILKITKKGKRSVSVVGKKKGTAYIKAKYKGKTYKLKIRVKGRNEDVLKVKDDKHYYMDLASDLDEMIEISVPNVGKYQSVYFDVEDPEICEAWWDYEWYDDEDRSGSSTTYLHVSALKEGTTRILLTNDYNKKEKDYITIEVF